MVVMLGTLALSPSITRMILSTEIGALSDPYGAMSRASSATD